MTAFTLVESEAPDPLGPVAIARTADHWYIHEGERYPGVTGILDVLDKSGPLMSWAARGTAEAALTLLETPGALRALLDTSGRDGAIRALTSRSGWQRDEAAKLGTEVHHLADLHITGQPMPPMSEGAAQRVAGYVDWWQGSGWTLRLSEALVVHPTARYGGTFDLLARDRDGRTVLADIKTGGKYGREIYDTEILQLAAYGMAELVAPVGSPTAYPMPPIDRYVVLHVTVEGVREVELNVGAAERQAFLACCDLAGWRRTVKGKTR